MSRNTVHQKALTAAASVALAFGTGCWKPPVETGPDTSVPSDTSTTDTTDTAPDSSVDDTSAGGAPDCTQAEDVISCCEELSAWCADAYPEDTDAFNECYYGPDFSGSTGCIPWGPPVPPASTRKLA